MADLDKALTDLCDKWEAKARAVAQEYAGYHEAAADRDARARTLELVVDDLRALLAERPPTAPVVDREMLGSEPDLRQVLAKVIGDAWQRGDSDVDAIIAYLDGGEGS